MTKARTKFFSMIGLALVAVLAFSLTFAFVGHIGVAEARESYYATEGDDWEPGTFTELNYGLYWYTSDSAIPKKSNPVDKSKPTLIFAHGWKQNEGYKQRDLLSLWESTNSQFHTKGYADDFEFETEYYKTLIGLGYNVAHFYWSQLSDDFVTCDEKIWTSNGTLGMSYVLNDGHGNKVDGDSANNPTKSLRQILSDYLQNRRLLCCHVHR